MTQKYCDNIQSTNKSSTKRKKSLKKYIPGKTLFPLPGLDAHEAEKCITITYIKPRRFYFTEWKRWKPHYLRNSMSNRWILRKICSQIFKLFHFIFMLIWLSIVCSNFIHVELRTKLICFKMNITNCSETDSQVDSIFIFN